MKVRVVYTSHCRDTRLLAEAIAKQAKTMAEPIQSFHIDEPIDLLVIGFEDFNPLKKDHELEKFIASLNREKVKNIALFNLFFFDNKQMEKAIDLCIKNDLPLMRETYSSKRKLTPQNRLTKETLEGGKLYIYDMITIINHYY